MAHEFLSIEITLANCKTKDNWQEQCEWKIIMLYVYVNVHLYIYNNNIENNCLLIECLARHMK